MGHTAAETSSKYDQPFFPRGLPQLEQLHPLQVRGGGVKGSVWLLQVPVLDLWVVWVRGGREEFLSWLVVITYPVLLGPWGESLSFAFVLKL